MLGPDDLINIRSSNDFYPKNADDLVTYKNPNNMSKYGLSQPDYGKIAHNESNFEQLFQKNAGWIAETKGKNFIKKKTGTGCFFFLNKSNYFFSLNEHRRWIYYLESRPKKKRIC
jgi:hypothetical protein